MKATTPTKPNTKAPLEQELIKARAREQVGQRKLDRLKDRFEKLQHELENLAGKFSAEREKWELRLQKKELQKKKFAVRCKTLQEEAAMWKSQLFEQMDRAEEQQADFLAVRTELAEAQWQLVEAVEGERNQRELELAKSQAETCQLRKALTESRAQADGLRNMGACLTAKLEKAISQRKVLQREHIRLTELAEERAILLDQRETELEALKTQLFEARGQLLTHQLESESWPALKAGLEQPVFEEIAEEWNLEEASSLSQGELELSHSNERRPLKLAALPDVPSTASSVGPRQLLHRASKTLGGWFRIGTKG